MVKCSRYQCTLPASVCLQRQDARQSGRGAKAAVYKFCGSGRCREGVEYRRRTDFLPADHWAAQSKAGKTSYQFFRKDAGSQRATRRRQALSRPVGEVPSIDRPLGARLPVEDVDDVREAMAAGGA